MDALSASGYKFSSTFFARYPMNHVGSPDHDLPGARDGLTKRLRISPPRFRALALVAIVAASACKDDDNSSLEVPDGASSRDGSAEDGALESANDEGRVDARAADLDASIDAPLDVGVGDASSSDQVTPGRALCVRLNDLQHPDYLNSLTVSVTQQYLRLSGGDCDVAKVIPSNDTAYLFANDILEFNLALWGCPGHPPAISFGLIPDGTVELTSADATRLIDHYVEGATLVLGLSPPEALQIRVALAQLSVTAITSDSPDFTLSSCNAAGNVDAGETDEPVDLADGGQYAP